MKSSFPNGSQFSPTQTPLPRLLAIIRANQPDRQNIKDAIQQTFFVNSPDPDLANNTIFALSEYQILDKPSNNISVAQLTAFGESLANKAESGDFEGLYEDLARNIILNLRGLELIQCIEDLNNRGTTITKHSIVKELTFRGYHLPPNGTHLNSMRQWFEEANLVEKNKWVVNRVTLRKILGDVDNDTLDSYASLSREQRAFALAFARLDVEEASSNKVAEYASTLYGVDFPEGGLPQSTLFALRDIGLIYCEKTTSGQGAKPYIVRPTEKLKNDFIEPIFLALEDSAGLQYRKLIRMPYEQILEGLHSENKHVKGLALEALAFFLGRLVGLGFVKWRMRTNETGGSELDVVMEGTNLIFSRWQIQCKNSRQATLEDIAKEVGIAHLIRSNVIMIVTTGRIGDAARRFAERIMSDSNYQIILLQKNQLEQLKTDPSSIIEILHEQSIKAMTLKRSQVEKL